MGLKIGALCTWSHVAMVVRVKQPDVALLYQTTPLCKAKDFIDGKLKNGVQINVMSEAVNGYNGTVAIRHLSVDRTPGMLDALSPFPAGDERPSLRSAHHPDGQGRVGRAPGPCGRGFVHPVPVAVNWWARPTSAWDCFRTMNAAASPVRNTPRRISPPKAVALNCFSGPRLGKKL